MMTDRSAEKPIVGDTALPYYFARHPANFRIWAPTSAELAMLEVPGHLHGNQIRRMLEVGGVDCNLFLLPQVSLRGAAGLGGGAAAIFRSVAVSPARGCTGGASFALCDEDGREQCVAAAL